MLLHLCNNKTIDTVRNHAAEKYIKHAFSIILDAEIYGLCGINDRNDWYMVLTIRVEHYMTAKVDCRPLEMRCVIFLVLVVA